jgi:hypothetical protein
MAQRPGCDHRSTRAYCFILPRLKYPSLKSSGLRGFLIISRTQGSASAPANWRHSEQGSLPVASRTSLSHYDGQYRFPKCEKKHILLCPCQCTSRTQMRMCFPPKRPTSAPLTSSVGPIPQDVCLHKGELFDSRVQFHRMFILVAVVVVGSAR